MQTNLPEWITVHLTLIDSGVTIAIDDDTRGLQQCSLEASLKVWNHSPTGFGYGYAGSGPAQTALAILLTYGLSPQEATYHHQRFKFDHVAKWKHDNYGGVRSLSIPVPIGVWLKAERATAKYAAFRELANRGKTVFTQR